MLSVALICPSSRPTRGERIEIITDSESICPSVSLAPHGARGLKFFYDFRVDGISSLAPHGARGLKSFLQPEEIKPFCGLAPHGARGLKW